MQLPVFMPLSPRFVFSSSVIHILTALSFVSLIHYCAHATDADSIAHDDHNHPRIRDLQGQSGVSGPPELIQEEGSRSYEPTFVGLDRSLLGRAPVNRTLKINTSVTDDIGKDDTHFWKVQSAPDVRSLAQTSLSNGEKKNGGFHELLKRQDGWWMTITLSICDISHPGNDRPQMRLNFSRADSEPPSNLITTKSGFGNWSLQVDSDVILSVYVDKSEDFEGTYTYELTASTDVHYAGLTFLDSDNNSTLLAPANFSSLPHDFPYDILVHPNNSLIHEISDSTCALKKLQGSKANLTSVNQNLTGNPNQVFHVSGLSPNTSYWAILNNSQGVAGGGFEVFRPINFTTKSDGNCAVIYNLPFCADTAYAVPYNPYSNLNTSLTLFYDNQAKDRYKNFNFSIQQIPCRAPNSAQYSLARNCSDCEKAYKSWLCAVTIPRCQDFSADHDWLRARSVSQPFWNNAIPSGVSMDDPAFLPVNQTRKVTNSSRNPLIDQVIKPGPWKEVLPCEDVCYRLVQSCPAALGFACPTDQWLGWSYAKARLVSDITCNDPMSQWKQNAASRGVEMNILGVGWAFALIFVLQLRGLY